MKERSKCDNCGWRGVPKIDAFADIPDLFERIEPGGVVPSGECPECGALCYPLKPKPKHVAHAVLCGKGHDAMWSVRIPNKHKAATKWFTVAECYCNPMTGDARETAVKIAALLNGD